MSNQCKFCRADLDNDFAQYNYCHNCILNAIGNGGRMESLSNKLIPGYHWELCKGNPVSVEPALNLMRRLISEKHKNDIRSYPEFTGINEPEYLAFYTKAMELGQIDISADERSRLSLDQIHKIGTVAQITDLSRIYPVVLIWMSSDVQFDQVHETARYYNVLLGDIMNYLWPIQDSIVKFLKSKELWFKGCHLVKNGEIIRSAKFKCGLLEPIKQKQVEFITEFIKECNRSDLL